MLKELKILIYLQNQVKKEGVFAENETFNEIKPEDLKFLLISYFQGELIQKFMENRDAKLELALKFFDDFYNRLDSYEYLPKEKKETYKALTKNDDEDENGKKSNNMDLLNKERSEKIQMFKYKKALSEKIKKLENGNAQTNDQHKDAVHKEKCSIHITLRDAISGELLGKGHLEYDSLNDKPEKYEEQVQLKDKLGNEVGHAIVEIEHKEIKRPSIEDEFKEMRKAIGGMMKRTNKMFNHFHRRFGRDWGFRLMDDLVDDFGSLMLGQFSDDDEKENNCKNCKHSQKKLESKQEEPRKVLDERRSSNQEVCEQNPPEVKICEEKL